MDTDKIRIQLLDAALICKNFVRGEPKCNYENYLLEAINESSLFSSKSQGESYSAPNSEENGQCDCISDGYSIDFKLLCSQSALQSRNLFTPQPITPFEGLVMWQTPKMTSDNPKYTAINATWLHVVFRYLSMENFQALISGQVSEQWEKDVCATAKIMHARKNLLLFLPYRFYIDKCEILDTDILSLIRIVVNDFNVLFQYRNMIQPELDTYISFVTDKCFVIAEVENCQPEEYECISLDKLPTYNKLRGYSSILADAF